MRIINFNKISPKDFNQSVVTMGVFDGVHKGHQSLIADIKEKSEKTGGDTVVITFRKHPRRVLGKNGPPSITSFDTRIALLRSQGVNICVIIDFDKAIAQIAPEVFVEKYLVEQIGMRQITIGENMRFGRYGKGDISLLRKLGKEMGYQVDTPGLLALENGEIISSSNIRQAVQQGEVEKARQMLGRPFMLHGEVVIGNQRGRKLGFPTANLKLFHDLMPQDGVYSGYTFVDNQIQPSLISVGNCPTFDGTDLKVEVYLLDFSGNLYGQNLETYLLHKIRGQETFSDVESLCARMREDENVLKMQWPEFLQKIPMQTPITADIHF